jgi:hypothetical protein
MKKTIMFILTLCMITFFRFNIRAQQCTSGNCANGTGTMSWNKGEQYTGQWINGTMDGSGTMTWKGGKKYTGGWKNGLFHGRGLLTWPTGETYDGNFSSGRMEGTGTMKWKNGDRYTGQWKNGQMNGRGNLHYANGTAIKGTWKEGRAVTVKPADAGTAALAGAWRIMCKCFPGAESPYNCPSTSFVFNTDGGGTFQDRGGSGTVTGTIKWTRKGPVLTIAQFVEKKRPLGAPRTFTYSAAKKWYAAKPGPHGPEQKIMSYCVIKKAGAR